MNFLFGTAPSAKTSTTSTQSPLQQQIQLQGANYLQTGAPAPGVGPYSGSFAAPLSPLQLSSLQGLENVASGTPTSSPFDVSQFLSTYGNSLNYGGPAPVTAQQITPSSIDIGNLIKTGVVDPATQVWNSTILPGIIGAYGRGAGGAFSSDAEQAKLQAGNQLETNIMQGASSIALPALTTNATLAQSAATANQGTSLSASEATANNDLATHSAILQALGLGPTAAGVPYVGGADASSILTQTLAGGAVPQQTEQTQLTGQYNDYLNQINDTLQRLGLAFGTSTSPTMQTNMIGLGGSTGLIPGILQAAAAGAAKGYTGGG